MHKEFSCFSWLFILTLKALVHSTFFGHKNIFSCLFVIFVAI